jgi:hypothetical protein
MKITHFAPWLLGVALFAPLCADADNSTSADGYTIHHNAFTADTLDANVARRYNIQRSKQRGVLNVSVIRAKAGTTGMPTAARIEVSAASQTGQKMRVPVREVKEQDAVYYIGEFPVQDRETIEFTIDVTPEGASKELHAKMSQEFFTK